jgi:type II restriction/modification system DNA methylase subunit YeeA
MNQSLLKSFAPAARIKFREAMEQRAQLLGLSADIPMVVAQTVGDKVVIAGYQMPAAWEVQRKKLAERLEKQGWEHVIDEAAYTWFNRLAALRYMEVHAFLPQKVRVLTPALGGGEPEVLSKAHTLSFASFPKSEIVALKMDGTRDEELYRRLILATCESLHDNLPLLFPSIQEDLELLLPENLLRKGSLLDWFTSGLPDDEWQEIEVLGWLYQYYISELKSEYMARKTAYKKEEIPAVTQLFTPKWIVQYLVHNSLGRSWLLHHPESGLKAKMPYYIEPAQQEPEVEAELKRLFSGDLNPEDIKLLDPAMGSGHILVTAYEVLREIYLERGYQKQQCARLILEKNLWGLDIDLRATEIACFALIMKAREDDPSILSSGSGLRLNLLSFRDCTPAERTDIIQNLAASPDQKVDLTAILSLFEQGTLFGSLIQIPEALTEKLPALAQWLVKIANSSELLASKAAESALVFVRLAQVLGQKYDQVVSNPPYMGNKFLSPKLRAFLNERYSGYEKDLFSAFIIRNLQFAQNEGQLGFMSPFVWMFISSYQELRNSIINEELLTSLIQLEYSGFDGATVPICTFTLQRTKVRRYRGSFIRLANFKGSENQAPRTLEAIRNPSCSWFYTVQADQFKIIPGSPIAYWVKQKVREIFNLHKPLGDYASPRKGNTTTDNNRFLRFWSEVESIKQGIGYKNVDDFNAKKKTWIPYNKGGGYRKWYGMNEFFVNWKDSGKEIRAIPHSVIANESFFFEPGLTWSTVTSSNFSIRAFSNGFIFDNGGCCVFGNKEMLRAMLCFMNSIVFTKLYSEINPTLNFQSGEVAKVPFIPIKSNETQYNNFVSISKFDWDAFETSWDFQALPWLPSVLPDYLKDTSISAPDQHSLPSCWDTWRSIGQHWTAEMLKLEEENNRLFIDAYGLQDELAPDVPIEQITLTVNPWYRYKPRKKAAEDGSSGPGIEMEILDEGGSPNQDCNEEPGAERTRSAGPLIYPEGEERMREDGARELVSYAIGCAMGRYSLDKRGLIYAEAGGQGFDSAQYPTFPADDDGILSITDMRWFDEDGADRVETFVRTVWGIERHDENLAWLAGGLRQKGNESPDETLRRYLSGDFYKDHLQTYKKRPIYWKFSSGKEKAFEALVYLHRYNKGTLSRMRMQFVVPLSGKIRGQMDTLDAQIQGAASTAERKRLDKLKVSLNAKLGELTAFDSVLNHYAQMQIELDLDDGVRVNYGKFGALLANAKDVVGKGEE